MGKGENAGYQHFLFFPQCFQKPRPHGRKNQGFFGKGLITVIKGEKNMVYISKFWETNTKEIIIHPHAKIKLRE